MPEDDRSWTATPGYRFERSRVRVKLYRLLCYFTASEGIAGLCGDEAWDEYRQLLDDYEEAEIQHTLIEVAVFLRMVDDKERLKDAAFAKLFRSNVGKLYETEKLTVDKPLTIREACNKIIHASRFNFDIDDSEGHHARFLNPVIYLYGEWKEVNWKAELDVHAFIKEANDLSYAAEP